MSKKEDLIKQIKELNAEAVVTGLGEKKLVEMLEALSGEAGEAGESEKPETQEKPETPETPETPEKLETPEQKYVIAKGKCISSKKGNLGPGKPVDAKCFARPDVFENWLKKGFIVEAPKEVKKGK